MAGRAVGGDFASRCLRRACLWGGPSRGWLHWVEGEDASSPGPRGEDPPGCLVAPCGAQQFGAGVSGSWSFTGRLVPFLAHGAAFSVSCYVPQAGSRRAARGA